jgi:hypothetical protein
LREERWRMDFSELAIVVDAFAVAAVVLIVLLGRRRSQPAPASRVGRGEASSR